MIESPTSTATTLRRRFAPRLRRRVPGHRPRPGRPAARARRRRPRPDRGRRPAPVHLRVPRRRGARHPRLPGRVPHAPTARRRRWSPSRTTRRFGPRLLARLAVDRRVDRRSPGRSPLTAVRGSFRDPACRRARPRRRAASRCCTYDTDRAEAEHVADLLRRAHLEDGIAWSDMAVLVRSGRTSIPALRRVAGRGRRPGRGASDETPAGARAGRAAAAGRPARRGRPRHRRPGRPRRASTADRAEALLTSPLGGLDAPTYAAARRCARDRRRAAADDAVTLPRARPPGGHRPAASSTASRRAAADARPRGGGRSSAPRRDAPGGRRQPPRRCSGRLWSAPTGPRGCVTPPSSAAQSARLAHRDLDAVCALFEAAARAEEQSRPRRASASSSTPLVAQQIPADTLAERGVRGDAVRLLTAHRSKGLEWDLVVVAHVAGGRLARPAAPRHPARGPTGSAATGWCPPLTPAASCWPRSAGCSTSPHPRAARGSSSPRWPRPTTTASSRRGSSTSSVPTSPTTTRAGPRRPLSLAGLVAELRRTTADPDPARRPASRRRPAAGRPWPARPRSTAAPWRPPPTRRPGGDRAPRAGPRRPVRPADEPVRLSASALAGPARPARPSGSSSRRPGAPSSARPPQGFGIIVHALADRVAKGELGAGPDARDRPDGPRRRGVGPADVPHAVVRRARARGASATRWPGFVAWHAAPARAPTCPPRAGSPRSSTCPTASRCA